MIAGATATMLIIVASGCLQAPLLGELAAVEHGFSTRALGTTRGPDDPAGAQPDAVERAVAGGTGRGAWRRRQLRQVHGARVVVASAEEDAALGPDADALVSGRHGDLLVVRTADCLAVLAAAVDDEGRARAVAAAHAGWRGLVAGVVPAAVAALRGLAPGCEVRAALGPAIGPCCFEIGPDVAAELERVAGPAALAPGRGDHRRPHGDLAAVARRQLAREGVRVQDGTPPCTRCEPLRFHSHRAAGPKAGRLAAWIGLRPARPA